MKYELIPNTSRGVLIDRTPILQDVKDTFEVSFLLPGEGAYLVLFRGADGVEYRKTIKDGACRVPKELLKKEQYVEVTVCKIDNDKILQSWDCEPLKVTAFLNMRNTQWQLSGGMDDKHCLDRLTEIETLLAEQSAAQIAALQAQNAALRGEIAALRNEVNNTLASHQTAIMALAETVSQNNVL